VALAREGCHLVPGDILEELPDGTPYPKAMQADLNETVGQVRAQAARCIASKVDGDPAQAAGLVETALQEFGPPGFPGLQMRR
jgi:hypothetical protein